MAFTNEELQKIKADLPRGAQRKLAVQFDLSYGAIRNILAGNHNNDEVVLAAFEMGREYRQKLEQAKKTLSLA